MDHVGQVINAMIAYYTGDVRRINHFLKVYGFAKAIGEMEGLEKSTQEILEIAALTHDIGIKYSEKKYNRSVGNYQQIEGPPEAKTLLEGLDIESGVIDRVCWLIAHHHTYTDITKVCRFMPGRACSAPAMSCKSRTSSRWFAVNAAISNEPFIFLLTPVTPAWSIRAASSRGGSPFLRIFALRSIPRQAVLLK